MLGFVFFLFGIIVTIGMCGLAAWSDFRGFRIPNIVSLVIITTFILTFTILTITGQKELLFHHSIINHLMAMLIVFLITGALFFMRQLGAGDAKFASAVSLWLGIHGLATFLFYMAFTGGIIGVISIILKKKKPFKNLPKGSWPDKAQNGFPSVPYGIAIAIGAIIGFIFNGYFSFSNWVSLF